MPFNDALLVIMANAADTAITHIQLHSSNAGPAWTTGAVGSRTAVNFSVDADGDLTVSQLVTGLSANQAIGGVSYWSASSGGTNYGGGVPTGDATANSAGEYTVNITENSVAA